MKSKYIDKQFSFWFISGGIIGYTSIFFGFEIGYSKKHSPGFLQITLLLFGISFAIQFHGKLYYEYHKNIRRELEIEQKHLISTAKSNKRFND